MRCKALGKVITGLSNIEKIIAGLICLAIGMVFIVMSFNSFENYMEFNSVAVQVSAEVVDVEKITKENIKHSSYSTRWIIYVSYEYEGEKYEHIEFSIENSNSYEKGDVIKMYIQPENPTDIRKTKEVPFENIAILVIGVWLLICSISNFASISKEEKKKKMKVYGINKSKTGTILLLICLFFAMIIGSVLFDTISFAKNAEEVEAKVSYTTIERSSRKKKKSKKVMYIDYEYNGKKYDDVKISKDVPSTADEGEMITVYVTPYNPSVVRSYRVSASDIVGVGIFALVMGFSVYVFSISFNKKRKNPYKTGKLIMATVDEIMIDYNITVNKDNRRNIRCSYIDIFTGQRYEFVSNKVWCRLEDIFAVGDQIPVYVMPNDYSKYYVELEPEFEQSNAAEFIR